MKPLASTPRDAAIAAHLRTLAEKLEAGDATLEEMEVRPSMDTYLVTYTILFDSELCEDTELRCKLEMDL